MFTFFVKADLNESKSVIDHSVQNISKYFKDLKLEVDASLFHHRLVAKTEEAKKEFELKRVDLIKKIVDLETECNLHENDMNQLLNKAFLLNKTLIFLDKTKCKNKFLFDRLNPIKLVILNNEQLTSQKIDALKQK